MFILWDIYEIRSTDTVLHGIKLRGRIRKFSIENEILCLVENASDEENVVRFALHAGSDPRQVIDFVQSILPGATITEPLKNVPNPVLSKIKVNDLERYDI